MIRANRLVACLALFASRAFAAPADYFAIHVVDDATGRGIPLVELTTTYHTRYFTDSAGYIAFIEPGLMTGDDVWFDVRSYGYESPAGPFGMKGVALKPIAGKSAEIRLKRTNIAERLYRMTGYGLYRDSVLLGKTPPIKEPLLNARVTGQDTVQTAIYKSKYYWFWQDTDQANFGLGCYSMTGATAPLPAKLDLDRGIDFTYFVDKPGAFARAMANVPQPESRPIWVDGMTVVKDKAGAEKMFARYVAVDHDMKTLESGLVLFDDAKQRFERFSVFPGDGTATLSPSGRPYRVIDDGVTYVCYVDPDRGNVRVPAMAEAVGDSKQYEAFTCLGSDGKVVRSNDGKPAWRWTAGAARLASKQIGELVKAGALKSDEVPLQLRDVETKKSIRAATGSIAWSPYLQRWAYVCCQKSGDTNVGEIWLATANSPDGPWRDARKIATHAMKNANMDFYNVIQHDELRQGDGRFVYFEGTFVNTFSGTAIATPYYSYNNIMYRVDLDDPRIALPDPPAGLTTVKPTDATP